MVLALETTAVNKRTDQRPPARSPGHLTLGMPRSGAHTCLHLKAGTSTLQIFVSSLTGSRWCTSNASTSSPQPSKPKRGNREASRTDPTSHNFNVWSPKTSPVYFVVVSQYSTVQGILYENRPMQNPQHTCHLSCAPKPKLTSYCTSSSPL